MKFCCLILILVLNLAFFTQSSYAIKDNTYLLIDEIDYIFNLPEPPDSPELTRQQRYKIREKLDKLFKGVPKDEREEALELRKDLFVRKKMWPMPAGIPDS
jgi:hypothetical protein